ncbi:hypothetical protein [Micromonospora zamorensis]|uniref:hypothetical protein n=1 Tax=Micromonospora zamorensis TaxID=709883 RepID=UPI0033A1D7C0
MGNLQSAQVRRVGVHGVETFPVEQLEARMAARGKALTFSPEEVEDLMHWQYGAAGTFPVLAMLFPYINTRNIHHVDHVFPRSLLTTQSHRLTRVAESTTIGGAWFGRIAIVERQP